MTVGLGSVRSPEDAERESVSNSQNVESFYFAFYVKKCGCLSGSSGSVCVKLPFLPGSLHGDFFLLKKNMFNAVFECYFLG